MGARAVRSGVVGLAFALVAGCTAEPTPRDSTFDSARLDALVVPEPAPEPDVSRTVVAQASLTDFGPPLDACRGPVAIDVGESDLPVLVAEHDYCGGADWIPGLGEGDVVALDGPGVREGRYRVDVVDTYQRRQARVRDLRPEADVVLQTCISNTQLILVAATLLD